MSKSYLRLVEGEPEGSLFNSYYTELLGGLTPFPGLLHFTLDTYFLNADFCITEPRRCFGVFVTSFHHGGGYNRGPTDTLGIVRHW